MLTDIQATTNSVSFSDRTVVTMPTIDPASLSSSSLTQESIEELDANFKYASKKGKETPAKQREASC
ncbi:hypothetical protein [Wolbachia endosymbiont (group E) of Neria commutata]|uniref:hypothetical protein n=1 Tax=Wolbachia endosymbiont (group E) of Neria commutata TaxID=3066149 RepID=UPI003132BF5C